MSTTENNEYNSNVEERPRYKLPDGAIQHQNKNSIQSDEGLSENNSELSSSTNISVTRRTKLSPTTVLTDSLRSSVFTYSSDEEFTMDNIVEQMKNEEQRMKKEFKSMKHGEELMKHEITLLKYRQYRIEYEIELMKCREKSVEEIVSVQTSEEIIINEVEQMKKCEKQMSYEIERMKHYETRLINEIRSIENEINHLQYLLPPDYYDEICQNEIKFTKHTERLEELSNERNKRKIKLREHSNEIKKRKMILEEYSAKQIEFENKHKIIRDKIKQEKERIDWERKCRKTAIKQRKKSERELLQLCIKLLKREIDLLKHSAERIRTEAQSVQNDEYHRLREELSEKRDNLCNLQEKMKLTRQSIMSSPEYSDLEEFEPPVSVKEFPIIHNDDKISIIMEQPKNDIFLSCAFRNNSTIACIKDALPQHLSIHFKRNLARSDIKTCLDNTSTAVIAIINNAYEVDAFCPAEIIHIFKRQFPLILVITEQKFEPNTIWLNMIWQASSTKKVFLDCPNFEENLRTALVDSQWNLSPNLNIPTTIKSSIDGRSKRFLGDLHEWTVDYNNPAQVSQNYRQLISDPFRIATDTKLQDIYYNYIRMYFENSNVMELFWKGAIENDIRYFILAYTQSTLFSSTLNRHLSDHILFYFEPTLHDTVDYQLVKSLVDFAALCIYRQELNEYLFSGTVYRRMALMEENLSKYSVGTRIMNTTFLSTSKKKGVVNVFREDQQQEFVVICTYVIHHINKRRTALRITDMSSFPDEQEVLILPFSPFYVESVKRSADNPRLIEMVLVEDDTDAYH